MKKPFRLTIGILLLVAYFLCTLFLWMFVYTKETVIWIKEAIMSTLHLKAKVGRKVDKSKA